MPTSRSGWLWWYNQGMAETRKSPWSILIVDDEVDLLRMAALLVKELWPDAIVATAQNGNDAIKQAFEHQPDLVLTDIKMPGLNGIELVRTLREAVSSGTTKVVVWTGYHTENSRREALLLGADAYLTKPVDAPTLRLTLTKLLVK